MQGRSPECELDVPWGVLSARRQREQRGPSPRRGTQHPPGRPGRFRGGPYLEDRRVALLLMQGRPHGPTKSVAPRFSLPGAPYSTCSIQGDVQPLSLLWLCPYLQLTHAQAESQGRMDIRRDSKEDVSSTPRHCRGHSRAATCPEATAVVGTGKASKGQCWQNLDEVEPGGVTAAGWPGDPVSSLAPWSRGECLCSAVSSHCDEPPNPGAMGPGSRGELQDWSQADLFSVR